MREFVITVIVITEFDCIFKRIVEEEEKNGFELDDSELRHEKPF